MAATQRILYGLVNYSISIEFHKEWPVPDQSTTTVPDPYTNAPWLTFTNTEIHYKTTIYGPGFSSVEGYLFTVIKRSFGGYWLQEFGPVSTLPPPTILEATYTVNGTTFASTTHSYAATQQIITRDFEKDGDRYPLNTLFTAIAPPGPEERITVSITPPAGRIVEPDNTDTTATFIVSLDKPSEKETITVDYNMRSGTALGGVDFSLGAGTLTFRPGETRKTVTVTIKGDLEHELGGETFHVDLSNPPATGSASAIIDFSRASAIGLIEEHRDPASLDREIEAFSPVIDNSSLVLTELAKLGKVANQTHLGAALSLIENNALIAKHALELGGMQREFEGKRLAASKIADPAARETAQRAAFKELHADSYNLFAKSAFILALGSAATVGAGGVVTYLGIEAAVVGTLGLIGLASASPVVLAVGTAIVAGMVLDRVYDQYLEPLVTQKANEKFERDFPVQKPVPVYIEGRSSNDVVYGGDGNDALYGGGGKDKVMGHAGNDDISGGAANDVLSGGKGKDAFIFDARLGTSKTDRKVSFDKITDFNVRDDSFHLDNAVFKKLGAGSATKPKALKKSYFEVGTKAKDKDDYLIYDRKTGIISYDPDGSGAKAAIEFAQVKKGLALTQKDFFVI